MGKYLGLLLILLIAASLLLVGCSAASSFAGPEEHVTFIVRIDVDTFSPEANLRVRIWDAGQLKIAESNANCAVSYNQETQTEEVHCPGGVEYQEASPEEFEFLMQDLGEEIKIASASVTVFITPREGTTHPSDNGFSIPLEILLGLVVVIAIVVLGYWMWRSRTVG